MTHKHNQEQRHRREPVLQHVNLNGSRAFGEDRGPRYTTEELLYAVIGHQFPHEEVNLDMMLWEAEMQAQAARTTTVGSSATQAAMSPQETNNAPQVTAESSVPDHNTAPAIYDFATAEREFSAPVNYDEGYMDAIAPQEAAEAAVEGLQQAIANGTVRREDFDYAS